MAFFKQFPKFAALPLLNFGVDLKFDHIPLRVYYQSYIMQVIDEKPLGGGRLDPPPPPGTGRGKKLVRQKEFDFRSNILKQISVMESNNPNKFWNMVNELRTARKTNYIDNIEPTKWYS